MNAVGCIQIVLLIGFFLLQVVRTLQLRARGIRVWLLGRTGRPHIRILEATYPLGLVVWGGLILLHGLGWESELLPPLLTRRLLPGEPVRIIGLVLAGGALLLNLVALRALGESWRVGLDSERPGPLVTRGVYRWSRHPIMLTFVTYGGATWLTNSTLPLLLAFVVIFVSAHYQVRLEERHLLARLGETYRRYMEQVPRFF